MVKNTCFYWMFTEGTEWCLWWSFLCRRRKNFIWFLFKGSWKAKQLSCCKLFRTSESGGLHPGKSFTSEVQASSFYSALNAHLGHCNDLPSHCITSIQIQRFIARCAFMCLCVSRSKGEKKQTLCKTHHNVANSIIPPSMLGFFLRHCR